MAGSRITTTQIKEMKAEGQKIVALTAWDYASASIVDRAGVNIVLVGDSLSMTIRGDENTLSITLEDMIYHTRMVANACKSSLVIADMPFLSYQINPDQAVLNAGRFLKEAGANGVKIEGGAKMAATIRQVTDAGIPVMGHIGLTPQSINVLGGYKVQARSLAPAKALIEDAEALGEAGVFSMVLECVPAPLAAYITEKIDVPTIGIGAGKGCDGQIQVTADLVGLLKGKPPKHAKKYADIDSLFTTAVKKYARDVEKQVFPSESNSFEAGPDLLKALEKGKL